MSTYAYTDSKVVDNVQFKKVGNGSVRAYLHARDAAGCEEIKHIISTLRSKDWECIPFTVDGIPALEVRGFKRESELITFLDQSKIVEGKPVVTKNKEDEVTWLESLNKRRLQASGLFMLIADTGFINYGIKERSWQDVLAGLGYLSGSATLLAYGNNDQSRHQIREVAQLVLDHAKAKGFDISDDSAAASIGEERKLSPIGKLNAFFEKHPSEIGNMCYVGAGAFIAASALKRRVLAPQRSTQGDLEYVEQRKSGMKDVGLGTLSIASGLTATFVKEKARDPDVPRKHGLAGITEWIQESPLRIASWGYIGSTLCHASTTFGESRSAKKLLKEGTAPLVELEHANHKLDAIGGRKLFIVATLIGEFLMSISSKGHGEGVVSDTSVDDSAVAIMADLIVKQPTHRQEDLIVAMGQFLGSPKVLAIKDEDAIALLRKQVEIMRQNPWAKVEEEPEHHAAPGETIAEAAPVAATVVPKEKAVLPSWQGKLAHEHASPHTNLAI